MQVKDEAEGFASVTLLDATTSQPLHVSPVQAVLPLNRSTDSPALYCAMVCATAAACNSSAELAAPASSSQAGWLQPSFTLELDEVLGSLAVCEPLAECLVVQQQAGPAAILDLRTGEARAFHALS